VEISRRYDAVFRSVFRAAGLPEDLAYLPLVESSYQIHARSSAGATGVWQFTRATGRSYLRIDSSVDERYDPVAATEGAARYLSDAHDRLGDWALALTSYNYGVAGVARAAKAHGADIVRIVRNHDGRTFGFASRNFYAEFLAAREIARDPVKYYGPGLRFEPPLDDERVELATAQSPGRLARRYGVDLQRLVELNPAWTRRAVRGGLAIPAGTSVWLPAGTLERAARGETTEPDLTLPAEVTTGLYRVRPGDTLSGIAVRHGISVARLRALNDIASRDARIYVDETLRVGGATDRRSTHVVAAGDTLLGIALHYGVRLTELLRANDLDERSVIVPGQRIRIPAG
jgi:membrane-bound lytic murein transglycosylase D